MLKTYDGYARLVSYAQGGTTLAHSYNGLDDRVATVNGGDTRRFVYDGDGRLLGEYGTSATDVKAEYLWLAAEAANDNATFGGGDGTGGYTPLAISSAPTSGTPTLVWIHANHLGVPITTTDATGAEVAPSSSYTALGFPGQMKTLPDLWYNRHRDYDPTVGRYIQADPIGLDGDANPFAYAENNPLGNIDPEGLKSPSAVDVAKVGFDWWFKRQLKPARATPWGRAIGAGEAIGAGAAVGVFLCSQGGGDDDHCQPYYDEIDKRLMVLRRRLTQFRQDIGGLPETNPIGVTGRTRVGEAQAFYDAQAGLRKAIINAQKAGCRNIPSDAWRLATMPLNSRYPRPIGKYNQ